MIMTLAQAIEWGRQQLPHSDSPKLDAECLLAFCLQQNRTYLYTWPEKPLTEPQRTDFTSLVEKRAKGHPIAHLTGFKEFWGLDFQVSADTLIPRPDTEILVEKALELIFERQNPEKSFKNHQAWLNSEVFYPKILDLGTGTGAIACALKSECRACEITATDFHPGAVHLARQNAQRLGLAITIKQGNWFEALDQNQTFDFIVSNPPYIEAQDAHLSQGDVRFEPLSALTSGQDGLDDIRHILKLAPTYLNSQGWILIEHGYHQAHSVQKLFAENQFQNIETLIDYGQNPRVTLGQRI